MERTINRRGNIDGRRSGEGSLEDMKDFHRNTRCPSSAYTPDTSTATKNYCKDLGRG